METRRYQSDFCPRASHHLSLQLHLSFCTSSVLLPSQGDSLETNVTPLTLLLRGGGLFGLAAVHSHMLMFHIPQT